MLDNGSLDNYLIKLKKILINIDKNKEVLNTCLKKETNSCHFKKNLYNITCTICSNEKPGI